MEWNLLPADRIRQNLPRGPGNEIQLDMIALKLFLNCPQHIFGFIQPACIQEHNLGKKSFSCEAHIQEIALSFVYERGKPLVCQSFQDQKLKLCFGHYPVTPHSTSLTLSALRGRRYRKQGLPFSIHKSRHV